MAGLVLEPLEVAGPLRWRWLLRTEEGEALASHQVALPAGDYEHRGFTDAFVVFSFTAPSLNSGYWVEMETTGKYAHRDDAAATSTRVIAAGFAGAYPRCLGSSATACGS